jgi:chaperone modulatory protein CbpM
MNPQAHEWTWLDNRETVSVSELSEVCGLTAAELGELVDYGALAPVAMDQEVHVFRASWVSPLRIASKLRRDYDLELFSVAMLVGYLSRIETLERELQALRAQQPDVYGPTQD